MTKASVLTKTKVCRKCGRELSINDFYANKGTRDGHRNVCKHCYIEHNLIRRNGHEYTIKHRTKLTDDEKLERRNEYMRKYRDANREKVREISRRSKARKRAAAAEEEKAKKKKRLPNGQGPRHDYHAKQWRERKDELKLRNIERQVGHKIEDKADKPQPRPAIIQPRLCEKCKNWPCFDGIETLESDFAREGCHGFKQRENN